MWPFKKSRPAEKEKAFLITQEAQKQHIKEHMLLELISEHLEYHNGQWVIPGIWMDGIQKAMEEGYDKVWAEAMATYTTTNFGTKYEIYVASKK